MERYGCLIIGIIIALFILTVTVYYWSGWLNRPVGRPTNPPTQTLTLPLSPADGRTRPAWPDSVNIPPPRHSGASRNLCASASIPILCPPSPLSIP